MLVVRSIESSEASKYGIQNMGIVINGKITLHASFEEKNLKTQYLKKNEVKYVPNAGRNEKVFMNEQDGSPFLV
jgi:hypothetical protein